jgi:hypothetical protein
MATLLYLSTFLRSNSSFVEYTSLFTKTHSLNYALATTHHICARPFTSIIFLHLSHLTCIHTLPPNWLDLKIGLFPLSCQSSHYHHSPATHDPKPTPAYYESRARKVRNDILWRRTHGRCCTAHEPAQILAYRSRARRTRRLGSLSDRSELCGRVMDE